MWIDTHCHIDMLASKDISFSDDLLSCITIGTDLESCHNVVKQTKANNLVFGALGIHPHEALSWSNATEQFINEEIEKNKKIVGIGECGFDFYYSHSSAKDQEKALVAQIELALNLELPLVIHCRDAQEAMEHVLEQYQNQNLRIVFHSFTGSKQFVKKLLDKDFYISFNGIVTFKNATDVRDLLNYVPLNRLLLETDSPFLSPSPLRGKENNPNNIALVGNYIASFLSIPAEQLATQTKQNTLELFCRMKPYFLSS